MPDENHDSYITITQGIAGYFAIWLWRNPELGGFWEPYDSDKCYHEIRGGAEPCAKAWAEAEGLEFRP